MHDVTVRHQVLRLPASGFSVTEASRRTGVTASTIRSWRDLPADDLLALPAGPA